MKREFLSEANRAEWLHRHIIISETFNDYVPFDLIINIRNKFHRNRQYALPFSTPRLETHAWLGCAAFKSANYYNGDINLACA